MTYQEKIKLNETIAEFMGLKRGVDFVSDKECAGCEHCYDTGCSGVFKYQCKIGGCYNAPPDYTADENWGKVIRKLLAEPKVKACIHSTQEGGERFQHAFTIEMMDGFDYYENGDTIGEAVCYATIKYLHNEEGK
jgi:hypothetical protein